MNKPHKHAALIKAWADGAKIQYREHGDIPWKDTEPAWVDRYQYRIKPKTMEYRLALMVTFVGKKYVAVCNNPSDVGTVASNPYFLEWLGDWQEVVVD